MAQATKTAVAQAKDVQIHSGAVQLYGDLSISAGAQGVVLFAHGSGSSRHSPRNQFVARTLREHGVGTLLFDLLTPEEEEEDRFTGHLRFDIDLLAQRLIGYFGSSTGGGAALVADAQTDIPIHAIVSRGGRPDLAGPALPKVKAPTLLLVGGNDTTVIEMNRTACEKLNCPKELRLVPGATHLFEEPGALEQVANMAAEFF